MPFTMRCTVATSLALALALVVAAAPSAAAAASAMAVAAPAPGTTPMIPAKLEAILSQPGGPTAANCSFGNALVGQGWHGAGGSR